MSRRKKILVGSLASLSKIESQKFFLRKGLHPVEGFVVRRGMRFYAYANLCAHMPLPLDWGDNLFLNEEESHLLCRNHGALFSIETGECVSGPCLGQKLKSLEIMQEAGQLWVEWNPQ